MDAWAAEIAASPVGNFRSKMKINQLERINNGLAIQVSLQTNMATDFLKGFFSIWSFGLWNLLKPTLPNDTAFQSLFTQHQKTRSRVSNHRRPLIFCEHTMVSRWWRKWGKWNGHDCNQKHGEFTKRIITWLPRVSRWVSPFSYFSWSKVDDCRRLHHFNRALTYFGGGFKL